MRLGRLAPIMLSLVLLGAACASGDDPTLTPPEDTGRPASAKPPSDSDETATVTLAESDDLGEHLADADGNTLYAFTDDTDGESSCVDACASTWPPLTVDDEPTAGDGTDADLLDTVDRDDGSKQVRYNDLPLYLYSGDQAPGDTEGQGLGDRWFVVDAAGELVGN